MITSAKFISTVLPLVAIAAPIGIGVLLAAFGTVTAIAVAWVARRRLRRHREDLDLARGRIRVLSQDLDRARRRSRSLAVMAKSSKAIRNEFLSSISHEVRTPMNTIMGMTGLVLGTELTDKQRTYLEKVNAAGDALLGLLNDLLDLSKIHANRLRLDPHRFALRDCVNGVVELYRPCAERKGLTFRHEIHESVPELVVGDPGRLRQILGVLIGNAVKFTSDGGIDVRLSAAQEADGRVVLRGEVSDTGVGIPEELHADIFEAFRQADGSVTREYEGCGIGLSIAAELVAMMDGHIEVLPRQDKGSTFRFTVRLGKVADKKHYGGTGDLSNLFGARALVVGGETEMRDALAARLRSFNMEVVVTETPGGAEGVLRQARQGGRPFRFILLNGSGPRAEAFDLAARVNQRPDLGHPSVVMVTPAGTRGEAARCRRVGIEAYLTFPVTSRELATGLLMVLDARHADNEQELITVHLVRQRTGEESHAPKSSAVRAAAQ